MSLFEWTQRNKNENCLFKKNVLPYFNDNMYIIYVLYAMHRVLWNNSAFTYVDDHDAIFNFSKFKWGPHF